MAEARDVEAVSTFLQTTFAKIHTERMEGIPILNPKLEVEVVGARDWNGLWLSVLITPWFINLMLLPEGEEQVAAWKKLTLGSSVGRNFPAGRFDFIVGEEGDLGRYQMCSLFSPVLEFEDQEAARITAQAALEALFDEGNAEVSEEQAAMSATAKPTTFAPAIVEEEPPAAAAEGAPPPPSPPEKPVELSRRGLISGKFARGSEQV